MSVPSDHSGKDETLRLAKPVFGLEDVFGDAYVRETWADEIADQDRWLPATRVTVIVVEVLAVLVVLAML